ncbi:MAG: ABC transporter substrate-binding protein [Candidatus Bipolaricaulota bacterium]
MKKTLAVCFIFALLFSVFGFGVDKGGTLTIHSSQTFKDLNPMVCNDVYSNYVNNAIFDELVYLDPETMEVKPYLAESWEFSEDKCEITFHIREGVKAHNGEVINAEDVAFTFNWIIDPDNASPNATEFAWLQEVEVVDDYTAKFIAKPDRCPFAPALQAESFAVVPKDTFLEKGAEEFNRNPVGSGPFEFVEWKTGDHIKLEKNDDYWLKEPNLDEVVFRPIPKLATAMLELEKGGVDITDNLVADDIPRFEEMEEIEVQQVPSLSYFYLAFNMSKPPFNNRDFRKAVAYSFSMDDAIEAIFRGLTGVRAYGAVPPSLWASDRDFLEDKVALHEDDEKASQLFDELREEGVISDDFAPTIYCPPDPRREKLATIVATNLKEHGINAEVQPLEWGSLLDLLYRSDENPEGDYGMFTMGWSGSPDPYAFLYYLFTSENATIGTANNYSFYKNEDVDDLIHWANTTFDTELREGLYTGAQRLIMRDYVHLPAYHYIETRGVTDRVHDYKVDPLSSMPLVNPDVNVWVEQD